MSNASRDQNGVPTMIAVSNSDGKTIVNLKANPTGHYLLVNDGMLGTNYTGNLERDENGVRCLGAISSPQYGGDGVTIIPLQTDLSGYLLVQES